DYWPLRRTRVASAASLVREKIPFFLLTGIACALTYAAQLRGGSVNVETAFVFRIANGLISYSRYIGKLLWPADLSAFYALPPRWPSWAIALSVLVIAGASIATVSQSRSKTFLAAGWLWFFGSLVQV